jgi:hypothetical protein
MSGNLAFNPFTTTNAANSFNTRSQGLIAGTAYDSPNSRFNLVGGIMATSATLPIWGGVGITELLNGATGTVGGSLGNTLDRAPSLTGATALTGFTVFDQAHAMVNFPASPVPQAAAGQSVNFYRLGSGARIAVAMDPALVTLDGDIITSQVSWDFALQRLVPYVAAYPANVITNAVWSAGAVTLTTTTAHGLSVGSVFTISGFTPSGYNGTFTALAGTTGSAIVYALASDPGADTVQGTLVAGGGALACKVVEVQVGNCMVVSYDADTGYATWDYDGSAAVILI